MAERLGVGMSRKGRKGRRSYTAPRAYATPATEAGKAPAMPAGTIVTQPLQAQQPSALTPGPTVLGTARPLGWTVPHVPFGPGIPIPPAPIDPLDGRTGRALPRRTEYPVSWNLPGVTDRAVPWSLLRRLADGVPIIRKCIEIRKSEMTGLDWDFVVSDSAVAAAMHSTGAGTRGGAAAAALAGDPQARTDYLARNTVTRQSVTTRLRAENAQAIDRLKGWWEKPDRTQDWAWDTWLGALMEEYLVLDAVTLYPQMTLGGDLHSLNLIDGSTIKPLRDNRGGVPQPPNPAYQQILWGFPRGEFTASPGDEVDAEYARDTLLYRPRHVRVHTPYGLSPTEQAIIDADLYMKRRRWMDSEYTDGVTPEMIIEVTDPMTPSQLLDYERAFNDFLSGNTAERHRAKLLPAGMKATLTDSLESRYRPDYDLFLIRLLGLAFDVMPTELGFPPSGGLGGKGMSDGEEDSQYRKAIRPTSRWVASMVNEVSAKWLGMPATLTFQFLGLEAEDEASAMTVMEAQLKVGGLTINEMRDRTGQPRYDIPEADMPMIVTARDVIPLQGAMDRAIAAAAPKQAPPGLDGQAGTSSGVEGKPGGGDPAGGGGGTGQDATAATTPPNTPTGNAAPTAGQRQDDAAAPQPPKAAKVADGGVVVAGLAVLAGDTRRVLLLQRAMVAEDPAAGTWEFPGGHLEAGETPLAGATREWEEEVGQPVPAGRVVGEWESPDGRYRGHIWLTPTEAALTVNDPAARVVLNPDDPDGDGVEVVAWWDPAQLPGNPALRAQLVDQVEAVVEAAAAQPTTVQLAATAGMTGEAATFRRYLRRCADGTRPWRPFAFTEHPRYVAQAANELAEAGDWAAAAAVLDVQLTL